MTGTRSQRSSPTSRTPSALASSGSSPMPGTRATTHRSTSASRSTWQVRSEGSPPPSNARSAGDRPWSPRSVTSRTSTGWGATTWPGELAMPPTPCSRPRATTSASSSGGSLSCCASSWPSSQPQATRTGPSQRPKRSYFTDDFRAPSQVFGLVDAIELGLHDARIAAGHDPIVQCVALVSARDVDERGQPVERREDVVFHRARPDDARPADEERCAHAAFPGGQLAALEWRGATVREGDGLGAVVGGEDNDRV